MPDQITILDKQTSEKIAAGEVITRPFSCVKELVENSLDAESTRVSITLQEAGKEYISVQDNGHGMPSDDLRRSIKRHATSKISSLSDLNRITTLGFRGEALSSIAAVSKMEIISRPKDKISGLKLLIKGGEIISEEETAALPGTKIVVKDLFYNTPARRKNMVKTGSELGKISSYINRAALAYPDVSFELYHQKKRLLKTSGRGKIIDVLTAAYGKDTAKEMIPISGNNNSNLKIKGFISRPVITRSTTRHQNTFVNKRAVQNRLLNRAVKEAYHTLLPKNRHPITVIMVEIDPSLIDINIHPQKNEIRFYRDDEIFTFLKETLTAAFKKENLIPEFEFKAENKKDKVTGKQTAFSDQANTHTADSKQNFSRKESPSKGKRIPETKNNISDETIKDYKKTKEKSEDMLHEGEKEAYPSFETDDSSHTPRFLAFDNLRIIDQLVSGYIILESPEGLHLIDQHAAQERIIYEQLIKEVNESSIVSQRLLVPLNLTLTPQEYDIVLNYKSILNSLGFEIDNFGNNTIIIRAVPDLLERESAQSAVQDIIENLILGKKIDPADIKEEVVIMTSCKAAVKLGENLSRQEMNQIISELMKTDNPYTCPHGRPTVINLTLDEIEKNFKRK